MKVVLLITAILLSYSKVTLAKSQRSSNYRVTIQNLTKGQPITPSVIAIHRYGFSMLSIGEQASPGLQKQAKDGATDILIQELEANDYVKDVVQTEGVVLPGQSASVEIQANRRHKISLTSMLARTNDAIAAAKNLTLPRHRGHKSVYLLKVYDAGAETNTESCSHIPAPPCNNPFSGPDNGEGFVHDHPGIQGIGDLDALRDSFGNVVVKVTIEKIELN